MKFTIDRGPLLDAIAAVKAVVPDKHTVPILTNFLITAHSDGLTITGTNLDMQATSRVSCLVEATGTVTVEAGKLRDIVRAMPEGAEIAVAMEEPDESRAPRLRVEAGRSRFKLATLPVEDFPLLEDEATETAITYPASTWARLIDNSAFAVLTGIPTAPLAGVFLHTVKPQGEGRVFRMIAGSNKGMSYGEEIAPEGLGDVAVILTTETVGTLATMIAKLGDAPVTMGLVGSRVTFQTDAATLASKSIDGGYPKYGHAFPWDAPLVAEADAGILQDCVNRVSILAVDASKTVRFVFAAGRLSLSARDSYGQESSEDMEIEYDGEEVTMAVPSARFLERIQRIRTESLIMRFKGGKMPMLMVATGEPKVAAVLMPIVG